MNPLSVESKISQCTAELGHGCEQVLLELLRSQIESNLFARAAASYYIVASGIHANFFEQFVMVFVHSFPETLRYWFHEIPEILRFFDSAIAELYDPIRHNSDVLDSQNSLMTQRS